MKLLVSPSVTQSKPEFVPSHYQQAVFDWATDPDGGNAVVQAVAGSGKTSTGVQLFSLLDQKANNIFVAFNKHIQMELQERLPPHAETKTYHALGFANIRRQVGNNVRMDENKLDHILADRIRPNEKFLLPSIKRMVGLLKSGAVDDVYVEDLYAVALSHDIELYDDNSNEAKERIFELTRYAYVSSAEVVDVIDFDDMPFLPIYHKMPLIQFDFIFCDEFQDTNRCQGLLTINSALNGRVCGVGDKFQSIYRFRGADDTAMDHLRQALNAVELPLSISYRCPKLVVDLVNRKFPEIKFEGSAGAKDGLIANITTEQIETLAQPKDMILCRVNADLIPMAFSFIRRGIKAQVKGRDIGKGLATLVRKLNGNTVEDMMRFLYEYRDRELAKAYRAEHHGRVQFITDKVETLAAIAEECQTIGDVLARCEDMFSDKTEGITLSSIHKAKGLEAERVFILRPDLMPHPAAKSEADLLQERNIQYVACTRSKNELYFVR